MNIQKEYCGHVSIIGKVNVGKSTLLNQIIGKKISIVSRKKNTTKDNITGIITKEYYQSICIDTPGIVFNNKHHKYGYKNNNFNRVIKNSVLILLVIDQIYWTEHDEIIFDEIKNNKIPTIILINKIDKINNKNILLPFIDFLKQKCFFKEIIPISAKTKQNINLLNNIIKSYLPKQNHLYPKNWITTNSKYFTISEIIREQLISFLGDELPSIIKVVISSCKEQDKENKKELYISAVIWVKHKRQKKIIIGRNGKRIKIIGTISRNKIAKEFCMKTHLFLWAKHELLKK